MVIDGALGKRTSKAFDHLRLSSGQPKYHTLKNLLIVVIARELIRVSFYAEGVV
jgi:hypothetical protein